MASAKDTFEPNTFLSNTFACGAWRGVGAGVLGPYRVVAGETHTPGAVIGQLHTPGSAAGETFTPGSVIGETSA